jgi:hypothetical protein
MFIKLKNGMRLNKNLILSYYENKVKNRVEIQMQTQDELYVCEETIQELDKLLLYNFS